MATSWCRWHYKASGLLEQEGFGFSLPGMHGRIGNSVPAVNPFTGTEEHLMSHGPVSDSCLVAQIWN